MFSLSNSLNLRTQRRRRLALFVPLLLSVFLLWGYLGLTSHARAQGQSVAKPPKQVLDLFDALDDIDHLRTLNPLKLTAEQLDKLIEAIGTAQAAYDRKVTAIAVPPVSKMGDEIRETKQKVLAGEAIPKDFETRVKAMETAFLKKRQEINNQNLASLSFTIKQILEPKQVETATKMAHDAMEKKNKNIKGTDDQFFNFFVMGVFIDNTRVIPLLKEMRAIADPNTSNGGNP